PGAKREPLRPAFRETNPSAGRRERAGVEPQQSAGPNFERPQGFAGLHDMIERTVELARGELDATEPVDCDQPARPEFAFTHGLDRGDERFPDARQKDGLAVHVHGLRHGPRDEIEADERPVADWTSSVAFQRNPNRVRAD